MPIVLLVITKDMEILVQEAGIVTLVMQKLYFQSVEEELMSRHKNVLLNKMKYSGMLG